MTYDGIEALSAWIDGADCINACFLLDIAASPEDEECMEMLLLIRERYKDVIARLKAMDSARDTARWAIFNQGFFEIVDMFKMDNEEIQAYKNELSGNAKKQLDSTGSNPNFFVASGLVDKVLEDLEDL